MCRTKCLLPVLGSKYRSGQLMHDFFKILKYANFFILNLLFDLKSNLQKMISKATICLLHGCIYVNKKTPYGSIIFFYSSVVRSACLSTLTSKFEECFWNFETRQFFFTPNTSSCLIISTTVSISPGSLIPLLPSLSFHFLPTSLFFNGKNRMQSYFPAYWRQFRGSSRFLLRV